MYTKIGVAHSNLSNSYNSGREAASNALIDAGIERADFAIVFCSGIHDPQAFLKGINSILTNTLIVGGSCIGIITNSFIEYEGYESAVTVFASDVLTFKTFIQGDLNVDERECGKLLGQKIVDALDPSDYGMMIFYDSSKQNSPPLLNFATWLFDGLTSVIPKHLVCAGAGLLSDMQFNTAYQFFNDQIITQSAVSVIFGGFGKMYTTILHGCKPGGSYYTITKVNGPIIEEINHLPSLEVIDQMLGSQHGIPWKDFSFFITLGVNRGEKFATFDEKNYANRLVLSVNEDQKSITMFEPDLKEGDEIQLMRRSVDLEYVRKGIGDLLEQVSSKKILYAFYIDCAGRAKPYTGGSLEDAVEVIKILGHIPIMGMYSGVEIAAIRGVLQPLDWTGVLCVLTE